MGELFWKEYESKVYIIDYDYLHKNMQNFIKNELLKIGC